MVFIYILIVLAAFRALLFPLFGGIYDEDYEFVQINPEANGLVWKNLLTDRELWVVFGLICAPRIGD